LIRSLLFCYNSFVRMWKDWRGVEGMEEEV